MTEPMLKALLAFTYYTLGVLIKYLIDYYLEK